MYYNFEVSNVFMSVSMNEFRPDRYQISTMHEYISKGFDFNTHENVSLK